MVVNWAKVIDFTAHSIDYADCPDDLALKPLLHAVVALLEADDCCSGL
jgi:hypothetical protein